ncbi:uncharacterized protein LOC107884207 [Acyrthosiphon pisum]|uniref:Activin types I and II receptor domain-containing protein n=1 Tax=Acyrthosiphon pisum TaxID=7029 RepID=A0A8R2JVZ4_ACYPI|nr:uncharacterized protein LOC107884207 [Acyrthosiphon pisum]
MENIVITILIVFANLYVCDTIICEVYSNGTDFGYYEECKTQPAYCYAIWRNNTRRDDGTIIEQGCTTDDRCNRAGECVNNDAIGLSTIEHTCCCNKNRCNKVVRWVPIDTESDWKTIEDLLMILACCIVLAVLFFLGKKYHQYVRVSTFNNYFSFVITVK